MMKNRLLMASLVFAAAQQQMAMAEDLVVRSDDPPKVISASPAEKYQIATIQGALTVNNGATVVGVTNYIGSATGQPSVLTVDGAGSVYGECTKDNPSKIYTCITNALGGKIVLKNGGVFKCYDFNVAKDVTADPTSGYIDVMEVEDTTTWNSRVKNNLSSAPARIRVKSGTLTFASTSTASYRNFKSSGKWVVDMAEGAGVTFSGNYRSSEFLTEAPLEFAGQGDVTFTSSAKAVTLCGSTSAAKVSFGHTGILHFDNTDVKIPESKVTITNGLKLLKVSTKTLTCDAALSLNAIESTSGGVFTGTGSITMGTDNADASITGDIGAASTLAFAKIGSGELTLSPETARLASLDVQGGSVRIRGSFASPSLTVAADASLVVDGAVMTIDGNWFNCAGAFSTTNGASLIVKTATGNAPVFPAGAIVTVSEYWIDGVKQERGEYTLGETTIRVVPPWSEDDLTVWTNDDSSKSAWNFPADATYLGMNLVSPASSLTFTGGDLTLGSDGIAVDGTVTADCVYDFDLPLAIGTSQTWDFGPAAVVLRQGVSVYEGTVGVPKLTIKANSTGGNEQAVTFVGGVFEPELELTVEPCSSEKTAPVVRFAANTKTVFKQYAALPSDSMTTWRYSALEAGAIVEFANGSRFVNRNCMTLDTGSLLILRGKFMAGRVVGDRQFNVKKVNDGGCVLFDVSEIIYETVNPSVDYKFNVNLPWTLTRDYSFEKGWVEVNEGGVFNLAGHSQKLEKITGEGIVTSVDPETGDALPALVELDYAANNVFANGITFAGGAGFRKLGDGNVALDGDSTGTGDVIVEAGEAQVKGSWPKTKCVRVSGGTLALSSARAFGKQVELHLTGTGVLSVPDGRTLRVAKLWVPDPLDPTKEIAVEDGRYDASSLEGRISGGAIQVGDTGLVLIFK